jgi:hypothetical protein
VLVAVGGTGVLVGVLVAVGGTGVLVGVLVAVGGTGVLVGVLVAVGGTGVSVGVLVGVFVGVGGFCISRNFRTASPLASVTMMQRPLAVWFVPPVDRSGRGYAVKPDGLLVSQTRYVPMYWFTPF